MQRREAVVRSARALALAGALGYVATALFSLLTQVGVSFTYYHLAEPQGNPFREVAKVEHVGWIAFVPFAVALFLTPLPAAWPRAALALAGVRAAAWSAGGTYLVWEAVRPLPWVDAAMVALFLAPLAFVGLLLFARPFRA